MIFLLLALPLCLYSQKRTYLGLNVSSFVFQGLDIRAERHINRSTSLHLGLGMRFQSRDVGERLRFAALQGYVQPKNNAVSLLAGIRFFNLPERGQEFPYLELDLIGVYFDETLEVFDNRGNITGTKDIDGLNLGISATFGYVVWLGSRFRMDIGLQLGFSKPRDEPLAYYYPLMGFTTFGFNQIGIEGGHLQPVINFKYLLIQDKRDRIREME